MSDQTNLLHSYLSSLTDPQLLYLYHMHISDVPTPFHKPKLIEDLKGYFRQEQTVSAMAALLEAEEFAAVTAAALTENHSTRQLQEILQCRGFSASAAERMFLQLEERLVLLPLQGSSGTKWHPNPLLKDYLGGSLHIDALFPPQEPRPSPPVSDLWFSPDMIPGWLSLLQHRSVLFDRRGMPKKQRVGDFYKLYPRIREHRRFVQLSQIARKTGVLRGSCHLDHEAARMLFTLEKQELMLHCAYSTIREFGITRRQFSLLVSTCRERWYDRTRLSGIWMTFSGLARQHCAELLDTLEAFGFAAVSDGDISFSPLYSESQAGSTSSQAADVHISKDFRIHIDRNLPLRHWAPVYRYASLQMHDQMILFLVHEQSILEALDSGMRAEDITEQLKDISSAPPELMFQFISEWAASYDTITLFSGIVLQCDERTARIITRHPSISSMITKTLAPGVFLFSEKDAEQLRSHMIEAGLPFVPAVRTAESLKHPEDSRETADPDPIERIQLHRPQEGQRPSPPRYDAGMLETLHHRLAELNASIEVLSELRYRINQKLILSPQQLMHCSKKRHIFEAKGFDYQGKLQLIRQALKSKADILEIQQHQQEKQSLLVLPEQLIRQGNSDILQGNSIPDGEAYRISVGKLFLVRKIRKPLLLPKKDSSDR